MQQKVTREPKLKRGIGFWGVTLSGVGIILGAGIYALIGKAACEGGNAIWMSFVLAALVALFTGLSYAELSSRYPRAGAEYVYTKKAFGDRIAFIVGWLIIIGGLFSAATVSLGFAGYFSGIFQSPILLTAIALVLLLSFIIFYGIKQSIVVAVIFTLIEAAGLLLIIAIGVPHLGSIDYLEFPELAGVFSAAALIFFAFIGFEEMTRLSEETKDPVKNIPKALLIAVAITTVIYVLVAISSVSVMNWEALCASNAPLADVAATALGPNAFILLAVIALFSTSNTVLLIMLANSRIIYGMSSSISSRFPLSRIHFTHKTPWVAILVNMIFVVAIMIFEDIAVLAKITDFLLFFTFIFINLSVIVLRLHGRDFKDTFRIPGSYRKIPVIPILGVISCLVLMASLEIEIIAYGIVFAIVGVILYYLITWKKKFEMEDVQ